MIQVEFQHLFKVPLKLEILSTSAAVDVDSLTVIGFMKICGYFAFYHTAAAGLKLWMY